MNPKLRLMLGLAAAAMLATLVIAEPAFAQNNARDTGNGIGNVIRGLAGPIVWSLGGLTALGAFMRRDVGIAFTALVITVILGLFVTEQGQSALEGFSRMLGNAL